MASKYEAWSKSAYKTKAGEVGGRLNCLTFVHGNSDPLLVFLIFTTWRQWPRPLQLFSPLFLKVSSALRSANSIFTIGSRRWLGSVLDHLHSAVPPWRQFMRTGGRCELEYFKIRWWICLKIWVWARILIKRVYGGHWLHPQQGSILFSIIFSNCRGFFSHPSSCHKNVPGSTCVRCFQETCGRVNSKMDGVAMTVNTQAAAGAKE